MADKAPKVARDIERLAGQLASAVSQTGSSEYVLIPLSVIATAVSLLGTPVEIHQPMWRHMAGDDDLIETMQRLWKTAATATPYLHPYVNPLIAWMSRDSEHDTAAARGCWAVIAGLDMLGTVDQEQIGGDLLGPLYQVLMSKSGKAAKGAFYTPMPLSRMIAEMQGMSDLPVGASILDPCCGSGGMLVAAIRVMRAHQTLPELRHWVANDIDPIAVALCGVNLAAHGIPQVTLTCENALAPPRDPREPLTWMPDAS